MAQSCEFTPRQAPKYQMDVMLIVSPGITLLRPLNYMFCIVDGSGRLNKILWQYFIIGKSQLSKDFKLFQSPPFYGSRFLGETFFSQKAVSVVNNVTLEKKKLTSSLFFIFYFFIGFFPRQHLVGNDLKTIKLYQKKVTTLKRKTV